VSRNLTSDTQSRLDADSGQDPFPVVQLTLGSQVYWFSDRDQTQDGLVLEGRVQDIGSLRTDIKVDRSGRAVGVVGTLDLSLLDEDKFLLGLLDTNDLQEARVVVYQWFSGQTQSDMFVVLKGKIEVSPVWREKDRCLEVVVETPRRLNPVPFAPTEADDLDVDLDHLGSVWPMCFGTPSDVPATPVKDPPRGSLVQDMTQDGVVEDDGAGAAVEVQTNVFEIDNPDEDFPQGVKALVKIADEYVLGKFNGNTLTISQRQVNHYSSIPVSGNGAVVRVPKGVRAAGQYIVVRALSSAAFSPTPVGEIIGATATANYSSVVSGPVSVGTRDYIGYCYKQIGRDCYIWNGDPNVDLSNKLADINRYPHKVEDGARWNHKAGSPVVVASVKPVWVANQIPSNKVVRVRAWRQVTHDDNSGFSVTKIVKVPKSLYVVNLNDPAYNGATTVTMEEMLSDRGGGWSDILFVTVESSQDNNTSRAVKYLLDNHSEGSIVTDPTSFAAVASKLTRYPSNFAILGQADVLDHVGDIAWQARCGLVWNGAQARIVYLSEEPTGQVMDLTDVNVAEGEIKLTTTPIEDVVTVFNVEWRPNYSDVLPKKLLYRTNVDRYGKREQRYSFWIYQQRKQVRKSAEFWAARLSRLWRFASADHWGLEGLRLDPLDYARWQIGEFLVPVRGLVMETLFRDQSVTSFGALLPIEAGTLVQSDHFWVSDSGDTAPSVPDYSAAESAEESEIIKAPPPDVITLQRPEQQVYHVVANQNEVRNPAASDWKRVEVRILDSEEVEARDGHRLNQEQIAAIDALDPDHVNPTLNTQRAELVNANLDLDAFIASFPSVLVTAKNLSASYMKVGDEGVMIKVPGGDYVVTPANTSGPFVVRVHKPPRSPAEGVLYADFEGTYTIGPAGIQEIQVLGDGSGIQEDDLILVFRDSLGNYFTPGGGASARVAVARTASTVTSKSSVPLELWFKEVIDEQPDLTETGKMPTLATGATVPSGYFGVAVLLDTTWYFVPPVYA
jgi:hypothetical protein